MKIVFLDSKTIGDDIDLSEYDKLGEVVKYDFSTTEEADRKSTRLNSSHRCTSRMPSSA